MFQVKELTFLGHHVTCSSSGIRPLEDKVQVVRNFPRPNTQHKLCEFLGLINFYHRFLNYGAAILKPLNDLLATPTGRKNQLVWTNATSKAFTAVKDALASGILLLHPVLNSLMIDASNVAAGAILQQFIQDEWRPIAFFQKTQTG